MATEQHSPEILSSGAGLAAAVAIEVGTDLGELQPVRARGYWEQVWRRFKRDKIAIGGGIMIILLILAVFVGALIARHFLGHGPDDQFYNALNQYGYPIGPWAHVDNGLGGTTFLPLGADSTLGRDEFLRLLYGARVSFEVALLATIGSMSIGILMGAMAGYFRG